MNRQAFLKDVISRVLSGGLDYNNASKLVAARVRPPSRHGRQDILSNCECALRHLGEWDSRTTLLELQYYWDCLSNRRAFDPEEVDRIRREAQPTVKAHLAHGVCAIIGQHQSHRGVALNTTRPSSLAQVRALERTLEFQEVLKWVQARVSQVGGSPYYLVRTNRLPNFLRELKLFFVSNFRAELD
jgi:hypothetical protein